MRRRIADRLRLKSTPALAFEVDRVFEEEAHIDELLRQVGQAREAASEDASVDTSQKKPD
jgi:ribosome-binding factor A